MTAPDLAALPPAQWLVKGVLPATGLACVFGPPSCGKSFLTLDLLSAVANGRPWFGHRTIGTPVVLVALEGEAGLCNRVAALEAAQGQLPLNFRFMVAPFALPNRRDVNDLAATVGKGSGTLVCLDTLNRAAPLADENSSSDMGTLIAAAKRLQSLIGGLVLLVHHSGKDASKGLRGHSSLLAALDATIEVTHDGDAREWKLAKSKDSMDGTPTGFRLRVVELGTDEDGDAITSCAVERVGEEGTAVPRLRAPSGGHQRIVWNSLGELLRESRHFGKGGAPESRPCVQFEAAVDYCRDHLTCEPKRKGERARQAFTGLIAGGFVVHREGWIWLP